MQKWNLLKLGRTRKTTIITTATVTCFVENCLEIQICNIWSKSGSKGQEISKQNWGVLNFPKKLGRPKQKIHYLHKWFPPLNRVRSQLRQLFKFSFHKRKFWTIGKCGHAHFGVHLGLWNPRTNKQYPSFNSLHSKHLHL